MCGHTRDPIIYSKFHRNPFKGFGAPGGQNLALPITLASRFYNSLYYRTSRDDTRETMQAVRFEPGCHRIDSFYDILKPIQLPSAHNSNSKPTTE